MPAFRRGVYDRYLRRARRAADLRPRRRHQPRLAGRQSGPDTGKADLYPIDDFRQVLEVNLTAPVYWALEMVGRIAEDRHARGLGRGSPRSTSRAR